jgi:RNA recognition motif-containing protein
MKKIYVGNLSFNTTEQDLRNQFSNYGEISEIALIRDKFTNKPKGFCFITFAGQKSAQDALEMNGKEFLGRSLKVNMAQERNRESGGRGRRW